MLQLLELWQESLGLVGLSSALTGAGFAAGLLVGLFCRRRHAAAPAPVAQAPAPPVPASAAPVVATVEATGSPRDKRRNPRRPGRSVEVFVAVAGDFEDPCRGVVLNRSVGGLGILVGNEYPVGSIIAVLPVSATHLTPWVEAEVKTCRKLGDDWELGLQFQQIPPYSTMVMFG